MRIQVGYSERNAPPLRFFFNNFLHSIGLGSFILSTVLSFFFLLFLGFFMTLVLSLFLLIEMALLELLQGTRSASWDSSSLFLRKETRGESSFHPSTLPK